MINLTDNISYCNKSLHMKIMFHPPFISMTYVSRNPHDDYVLAQIRIIRKDNILFIYGIV